MKLAPLLGIGLLWYVLYRARAIQNTASYAMSATPSRTDIPKEYEPISDQIGDPMYLKKLIDGNHEQYEEPGQFGVTQTTVQGINNTKYPTFGQNYKHLYA
jgi:hypothetical protein